jgi:ankyrin repeat protein
MNKWLDFLKNNDFIGVKKHINNNANINDANDSEESVLALAMRYRCDFDLVMLLVDANADIYDFDEEGVSIFEMAITYDNLDMVKYIIEKGIDVNKTNRKSRFTPLMTAVCYGRIKIAKLLIEQGADKEAIDSKGISVTDFARKMNKKSMLILLDYDENTPKNTAYAR